MSYHFHVNYIHDCKSEMCLQIYKLVHFEIKGIG